MQLHTREQKWKCNTSNLIVWSKTWSKRKIYKKAAYMKKKRRTSTKKPNFVPQDTSGIENNLSPKLAAERKYQRLLHRQVK